MKSVFVLFDSLNKSAMSNYGYDTVKTPNFEKFSQKAMTFNNHYVGSLPCMPARRDMHTGRMNFMHRSWGPLEPFDNSFPELLKKNGVYSHLISDHLHYFEDGGSGFHTRFNTWEYIRGQEHDPWIAMVKPPIERFKEKYDPRNYDFKRPSKRLQGAINREKIRKEDEFPGPKCFYSAFDFLEMNKDADNWSLMLECFDPHEPFHAPERFQKAFNIDSEKKVLDWPHYEKVIEKDEDINTIRANYGALVAMCDDYFGQLLDRFDKYNLWSDTALILTTDHGFLLSEHDWWGKCRMPYYEEISHIPLMVYDPRTPESRGKNTDAITQTMDLMPTILDLHGVDIPSEVRSNSLSYIIRNPKSLGRKFAMFGIFSGPIGITDGKYVLYYYPPDWSADGLREYTLSPHHMVVPFNGEELKTSKLSTPFDFTKGCPVLSIAALPDAPRIPMNDGKSFADFDTVLYNLENDPKQKNPIINNNITQKLIKGITRLLVEHDAPYEIYEWYDLNTKKTVTK